MYIRTEQEDGEYNIHIGGASKNLAQAVTNCASEYMFTGNSTNPVVNVPPATVNAFGTGCYLDRNDSKRIKELISLAKAHMEVGKNKIDTIKAIRSVTNFGLKDSKDLVDFACGQAGNYPKWITDTFDKPSNQDNNW